MNDPKRDEEVDEEEERKSIQTMLTEPSNQASIEMRLCADRIFLLQALACYPSYDSLRLI